MIPRQPIGGGRVLQRVLPTSQWSPGVMYTSQLHGTPVKIAARIRVKARIKYNCAYTLHNRDIPTV
jgi:hypothetical protein